MTNERTELLPYGLKVATKTNKFGLVIEQSDARKVKTQLMEAVGKTLQEVYDLDLIETAEGLYLSIPNEEEGCIIGCLDIKIKPLDTDLDTLADEYQAKLEARANRAAAKQEKK